uniref:Uncharacterized protein n=1 Tax=Pseudo-nitzschia australis TaxID=44445 RepID=A0A7S4AJ54_9STRA
MDNVTLDSLSDDINSVTAARTPSIESEMKIKDVASVQMLDTDPNETDEKMENVTLDSLSDDVIPAPALSIESDTKDNDVSSVRMVNTNDDDDSDRALLPSLTIGSNYSFSQIHSDAKLTSLNITPPTENVVGEVEVQVKTTLERSRSSKAATRSIFPSTFPKSSSSRNNILVMPSASIEKSLSLMSSKSIQEAVLAPKTQSKPHSSDDDDNATNNGLYLSDIDTTASSMIDDVVSFEILTPLYDIEQKSSEAKEQEDKGNMKLTTTTVDADKDAPTPPRRSSRLTKLREWQEEKEKPKETIPSKSVKGSKPISGTRVSTRVSSAATEKEAKKSRTVISSVVGKRVKKATAERSSENVRGKSSSKTSSSERESVLKKQMNASSDRRVEKKSTSTSRDRVRARVVKKSTSTVASPGKTSRSRKSKGEASISDHTQVVEDEKSSVSSSPRKVAKSKSRKIPNSRRKKNDKSSVLGGVLNRK